MKQLTKVFSYSGSQVRTVFKGDEIWFVAKDVCEVLDLNDVSKAVSRLDEDEKGTNSILTPGGEQNLLVVNEPGLYSLILTSRKEEAKLFKRWITHEVLPSIRKTGSYSTIDTTKLSPELQMFKQIFDTVAQKQLEDAKRDEKLIRLETGMETIKETFLQKDDNWRTSINAMINSAAKKLNGDYRQLRVDSYQLLEERARCDLNRRLQNYKYRLEESGATKTKINQATKMDVIEQDQRLKEIYTTIVKEFSISTVGIKKA